MLALCCSANCFAMRQHAFVAKNAATLRLGSSDATDAALRLEACTSRPLVSATGSRLTWGSAVSCLRQYTSKKEMTWKISRRRCAPPSRRCRHSKSSMARLVSTLQPKARCGPHDTHTRHSSYSFKHAFSEAVHLLLCTYARKVAEKRSC